MLRNGLLFVLLGLLILAACQSGVEETAQKGGSLEEWRDKIWRDDGPLSETAKTLNDCTDAIEQSAIACPQREGWRLSRMMEITDFRTDDRYEYQDLDSGGCPDTSPAGKKYQPHDERATFDSQSSKPSSEYQVVCDVQCTWWSCTEIETETWKGTFDGTFSWDHGDACSPGEISMQYEFEFTTRSGLIDSIGNEDSSLNIIATEGTLSGTVEPSQQPNPSMLDCEIVGGSVDNAPIGVDAGTVYGEQRLRVNFKAGTSPSFYLASLQSSGSLEPIDAPELLTFSIDSIDEETITGSWIGDPYASGEFEGTLTLTKTAKP